MIFGLQFDDMLSDFSTSFHPFTHYPSLVLYSEESATLKKDGLIAKKTHADA